MTEEAKKPVAVSVTRPYATEDEFVEREMDTVTRASVMLLGAPSRPQGVVLRFEVVLQDGTPLLRGEGRVVAFKERTQDELEGLTLRFTRLDTRSKALVDRIAGVREARARAALQASLTESVFPSSDAPPGESAEPLRLPPDAAVPSEARPSQLLAALRTPSNPPRPPSVPPPARVPPAPRPMTLPMGPSDPYRDEDAPVSLTVMPDSMVNPPEATLAPPPARREEGLARLRARAAALAAPSVESIYATGRQRRVRDG